MPDPSLTYLGICMGLFDQEGGMIWHTAFLGGINGRIATDNTKSFVQVYKQDPGAPSQLGYAQVLAGSCTVYQNILRAPHLGAVVCNHVPREYECSWHKEIQFTQSASYLVMVPYVLH